VAQILVHGLQSIGVFMAIGKHSNLEKIFICFGPIEASQNSSVLSKLKIVPKNCVQL